MGTMPYDSPRARRCRRIFSWLGLAMHGLVILFHFGSGESLCHLFRIRM